MPILHFLNRRRAAIVICLMILSGTTGCPVVSNLPAPGRVFTRREPGTGQEYHLYVPTSLSATDPCALVVTCHGTRPFDTATAQLREWKGLAEKEGFLVVAPELVGTSGLITDVEEQRRRQQEDEATILGVIHAMRAAYSVNPHQVFLTGWSGGGYAVLHTGLRHPEVFRALAVRQGNFREELVESCSALLDADQPVFISYGSSDVLVKNDALACIEWLKSRGCQPDTREFAGIHRRNPQAAYGFFLDVVRHRPRIVIRLTDDIQDNMRLTFDTDASFKPVRYRWDFGDGNGSAEAAPTHQYEQPGEYVLRVALWSSKTTYHIRKRNVRVPRVRIGTRGDQTSTQR